jgi:hypothetical protein
MNNNMWKSRKDYTVQDELGRWINTEFPPESFEKYPYSSGYSNFNKEYLFYQLAVDFYDVSVTYKGHKYIIYVDDEGCFMTDETGQQVSENYPTANDFIREFRFPDGVGLLDIVDTDEIFVDIYG